MARPTSHIFIYSIALSTNIRVGPDENFELVDVLYVTPPERKLPLVSRRLCYKRDENKAVLWSIISSYDAQFFASFHAKQKCDKLR